MTAKQPAFTAKPATFLKGYSTLAAAEQTAKILRGEGFRVGLGRDRDETFYVRVTNAKGGRS